MGKMAPIVPSLVVAVVMSVIVVVMMAATMKVGTATRERKEKRERPHRPWPLVHPFARAVPKPVAKPANASRSEGAGGAEKLEGSNTFMRAPPASRPPVKAILVVSRGPRRMALREPEQPAIRPEKSMYTPHAAPIKRPPMTASRGRKVDITCSRSIPAIDVAFRRGSFPQILYTMLLNTVM